MFSGFTEDTIRFLLDLKFHNNTTFFHEHHDQYVEYVQTPFYHLINDLAPYMKEIDPFMEIRPHKCLSRIHRDTRFSKDKSPYRDHHWFLFRRAAEPREHSLIYYFEFGPERLSWGLGTWGENRELMDIFRKKIKANPKEIVSLIEDMDLPQRKMFLGGTFFKRIDIPSEIPENMKRWYISKEFYIGKYQPPYQWAFSDRVFQDVRDDYMALSPFYQLLRGCADEMQNS